MQSWGVQRVGNVLVFFVLMDLAADIVEWCARKAAIVDQVDMAFNTNLDVRTPSLVSSRCCKRSLGTELPPQSCQTQTSAGRLSSSCTCSVRSTIACRVLALRSVFAVDDVSLSGTCC